MKTLFSNDHGSKILLGLLLSALLISGCQSSRDQGSRIADPRSGRDRTTLGWDNCRDCRDFTEELIAGWGQTPLKNVEIGLAVYGDLIYQDFRSYRGPVSVEGYLLVREPIVGPQCIFPAGSYEIFSQVGGEFNRPGDHFLLRNLPIEAVGSGRRLGFHLLHANFNQLPSPVAAPDGFTYHLALFGTFNLCGVSIQLGPQPL